MSRPGLLRWPILAISFSAFATIPFVLAPGADMYPSETARLAGDVAFVARAIEPRHALLALVFGLVGLAIAHRPRAWMGAAWIASALAFAVVDLDKHLLDHFMMISEVRWGHHAVAPFGFILVVGGLAFGWACLATTVVKCLAALGGRRAPATA
ncbi:MAG: hypothetical protein KIT31_11470 [Deltaproteobacteria bacterium]|nr:hypothetical protein [Deltaproteobacteria bacterium]